MEIEFGWTADGASWADAGARTGSARLGPRGLIQLLQNRLGLTRPDVDPAVRTAQLLGLIQQQLAEGSGTDGAWWPAASFAVDPWSTARQLLRWRDATVEAGWRAPDPIQPLPARLAALRDLEQRIEVGRTLAPGPADDLAELVDELTLLVSEGAGTWPLGIDALVCEEFPTALPGLWPRLLELLGEAGMALRHADPSAASEPPELHVVACRDEWTAADVAARFLAADPGSGPDSGADAPLALLAGGDTSVLDGALARRGLPRAGRVASSTDRPAHQVLRLLLDVAIAPVDVHQLAALLDLRLAPGPDDSDPLGLFPPGARGPLLRALTREPGVGGPAWSEALAAIDAHRSPAAQEAAHALDELVRAPLPAADLRPPVIAQRLDWLETRLRAVSRGAGPAAASLAQLASFRAILALLDPRAPLAPRTIGQIIDACGTSGPSPLAQPEAAPWRVVGRASHLAPGGDVLWWSPEGATHPAPVLWDPEEVQCLEAFGARVLDPELVAQLEVGASLRALRSARRVIAVLPGRRLETPIPASGLLAHLESELGRSSRDHLDPAFLVDEAAGTWSLAGRTLPVRSPAVQIPEAPADLTRRADAPAPHLLPERLSFSQADTLIGCRQKWTYQYGLGIRPASVAALPTGNQMIGTLVHALVERLVHEAQAAGSATTAVPSDAQIDAAFDALVPQYASELDLPGRRAERTRVLEAARRSLAEFFTRMSSAGLIITGVESAFEEKLDLPLAAGPHPVVFVGSRDVDARDAEDRPVVLDLKWTGNRAKHAQLYDDGEAIQLASYAWSLDAQGEREPAAVGYYLLQQGRFVSADTALDPRGRSPMDVREAWERMVREVGAGLDAITAGTVSARSGQILLDAGLDASASSDDRKKAYARERERIRPEGGLVVDAYCGFCDFAQLCRLSGDFR